MMNASTPEWVKDAVFYQIFPDRFARSTNGFVSGNLEPWDSPPTVLGFKGGDLWGVVEHLAYLEDLGVTALYLNPIFQSTANHRYHTHDYYQVDPILGGNRALRILLDQAHARGMRVVLDGVFNHASRGFFQFNHILENGAASPYLDWFIINGWPLRPYDEREPANYKSWWDLRALPEFNTDIPAVREFLWNVAEYWIDFGIDGWRLDVPHEIDDDAFWQEFRRRVKTINPEAYIVGEIWSSAKRWLQGDQFDAVMNYPFSRACLCFMGGDALDMHFQPGRQALEVIGVRKFANQIDSLLKRHDWEITLAQLNLLDSHDMPRFLTLVGGDVRRLKLATLFQMCIPGAPCIYYGDEIGLQGGDDPDCRQSFPWEESCWNEDLRTFVKRCIAVRHEYPALRRGRFSRLYAFNGVYAFLRQLGVERLVVILNGADTQRQVDLPLHGVVEDGTSFCDVFSHQSFPIIHGCLNEILLGPLEGRIFMLECSGRQS